MLYLTLILISFTFLQSSNSDIENGIVYPEMDPIVYFDPYYANYVKSVVNTKNISDESMDAISRMSVFLHETLLENSEDDQFNIVYRPKRNITWVKENGKVVYKIKMESSKNYWKFHQTNEKINIEDIYYSFLYDIKTKNILPSFYAKNVSFLDDFENESFSITYNSEYSERSIKKHIADLIILPHKYTKPLIQLIDDKQKISSTYIRNEYSDIDNLYKNIIGAGKFRIDHNQNVNSISLKPYELYGNKTKIIGDFVKPVELIKIINVEFKDEWWTNLLDERVNLVIDLIDWESGSGNIQCEEAPSYKVTSLIVNHQNNFLKIHKHRELISYMLHYKKHDILTEDFADKAKIILGPVSKSDPAYDPSYKYDKYTTEAVFKNDFKKTLESLGYHRPNNLYEHKKTNEPLKLRLLYNNSQTVSKTNEDICTHIQEIFEDNGILLEIIPVKDRHVFRNKLINMDFDLVYSVENIASNIGLNKYYGFDQETKLYGDKNYGRYEPPKNVQILLDKAEEKTQESDDLLATKKALFVELADEYPNIYLWSPMTLYGFNSDVLNIQKDWIQAGDFFVSPHKTWVMNDF